MSSNRILWRVMDDAAVFADATSAIHFAEVVANGRSALTWGEARRRLPPEALQCVEDMIWLADRMISGGPTPRLGDTDPFNWSEECPWPLALKVHDVLPLDLLQRFGEQREYGIWNQKYWYIPATHAEDLATELRLRGVVVERADGVEFW